MDIGFVGLGNMGSGMVRALLRAGHRVVVWNRTPERADEFVALGAIRAATPFEAAEVGVVFTMLADDAATEAVVAGPHGILAGLPRDGIHVASSTLSVRYSAELAERHRTRHQHYVAAPVFGRPDVAAQGTLRLVVAGATAAIERLQPAFAALGPQQFVVGEQPELAHAVKIAGNFLILSLVELLGEAFVLADKSGVARDRFFEVVAAVFSSPLVERYGKTLLERRFEPPGFRLALGLKDLRLALELAEATYTPLPIADLVRQHALEAMAVGKANRDYAALLEVIEAHAGLS
ncbi:MAG: NAD(P)-dependent oxidoreductase [Thermomicrobium sp.]|nr:NAD(P)-dependent oxidoreductase [Thermomicrobium sp.]